jgi:hypothetical protein
LLRTPQPGPRRQLWLGAHRAVRTVVRVRTVSDFLVDGFKNLRSALDPSA